MAPEATPDYTIGEAAQRSGISRKMIRHYEAIGLLPPVRRTEGNYRLYSERDIHLLAFVRRARDLGFSMPQVRELLDLWCNDQRHSREVKALTLAHIDDIDRQIERLRDMRESLAELARQCQGNNRPDCPILEELEPHHHD